MKPLLLLLGLMVVAIANHGVTASQCESSLDCPGDNDHPEYIFCCSGECCDVASLSDRFSDFSLNDRNNKIFRSPPVASPFRSRIKKFKRDLYVARVIGFVIMGLVVFGFCCFCGTCCYCIFRKKKRRGTVLQPPANQGTDNNTGYTPAPSYPPNYPPGGTAYPPAAAYPPAPSYSVGPTYPPTNVPGGPPPYPPETKDGAGVTAPGYPPVSTGGPVYPPASTGGPVYPPASTGGPVYPPASTDAPGYPPTSTDAPGYPPYPPNQPPPTYSEYPAQPPFNPNAESKT